MGLVEDELKEIKNIAERQIAGSKVETCVQAMVRINIQKTKYKQIVVCFQFPESYPKTHINVELKSRYISEKLLDGLTKLAQEEAKKYLGKPQIMVVLKFVRGFIDDHPLLSCSEEIANLKKEIVGERDEIKLKQKTSSVLLITTHDKYFAKIRLKVPEDYPDTQVSITEDESNYPPVIKRHILAQSQEIARQCVEAPKRKQKTPFVIKPSLFPVMKFIVEISHEAPEMQCGECGNKAFCHDPKDVPSDENAPSSVERVYCGHLYHHSCLDKFIKTPPFAGGKKCHQCTLRIYHDKWKLSPALREARWAHKQARQRELDEAIDFFA